MYNKFKHINNKPTKTQNFFENIKLSLLTVPYWLVQALPEMSAMKNHLLGHKTNGWKKTERTDERNPDASYQK